MDVFDGIDFEVKDRIVKRWKTMSESDKLHFINQVSLALTVWGSDIKGKELVVKVMEKMMGNGSDTLADFGLYVDKLLMDRTIQVEKITKIKRVSLILEGYRIKNALPSEPHKEI